MVAILFIFSFTALIAVSYFVERRREAVGHAGEEGGRIFVRSLVLPKGLFLSPGHTWTEVLSNGYARVGLDDFVRKLVGSIDRVEVLPIRTTVKRGQPLCTLHQANRNLTIRAPVSGTIVSVNPQHENPPSGLTADAYFGGWLAVVEPSDLASDIKVMRIAEEAKGWLNQELRRFREFVEESVRPTTMQPELSVAGTTLLDGGAPAAGLLGRVGPETWRAFEERFLSPEDNALLAP